MSRARQLVIVLLLVGAVRAEIIDRVAATVNGQPILQSDWDLALRYEAFLDQRPLNLGPPAARAALDRLIDQELLRQQVRSFHLRPVTPEDVQRRVDEIRQQIPAAATEAGWQTMLHRYDLTEAELRERVASQLEIMRFIEVRLRPTVRVDRASIEAYYRNKFLPELKQKGAREVPLVEVTRQIEEILSQQRMDDILSDWLRELRQQSEIQIKEAAPDASLDQEAR